MTLLYRLAGKCPLYAVVYSVHTSVFLSGKFTGGVGNSGTIQFKGGTAFQGGRTFFKGPPKRNPAYGSFGIVLPLQDDEDDEEDEDMNLGQETLVTARPGHASEFSAGQLPQYAEDTLIIHDDVRTCTPL